MRKLKTSLLLALLALLSACSSAVPVARSIRVHVQDDEGRALAAVSVEIDGLASIKTGPDGFARISLAPDGPPRARIGVSCPAGHRELPPRHIPRAVTGGCAKLELSFSCRPLQRKLTVVVHAPGAQGLWVRADGEPLGRIEADGTLHAMVSREPETELRLMIDTGVRPLLPRNPTHELRVADRDELVVFEQPLSALPVRSRKKTVAVANKPTVTHVPYEIRGNGG